MKLKSGILILFVISSFCLSIAQGEIDYKNKSLVKVLQKAGLTDLTAIEEIILPDSVYSLNNIRGKYFRVKDQNISQYQYIYVGRVNSCRAGGCSATVSKEEDASSEYFDYYILFDQEKTVQAVKVYNYQATHGHEITAKGWLKQFKGHDGSESLKVDKNIDAISGATISVYAITFDIETKTEILKHI